MPVITVSQLNNYMKRFIDNNIHLTGLWIKGEISNYKRHYSGHIYFTLKDSLSVLKVIMFKSNCEKLKFNPENGMNIMAFGNIAVYERDGIYQLYAEKIIPDGVGELYAAYQQLKNKLEQRGLFAASAKKQIPKYPKKIAVVTSPTGAAIRDILNVISRRYPLCDIAIYPVKVQGIGSAESICDALSKITIKNDFDTVILGRGGGSIEDLWAFNEEKTAYAIYNCTVPVISAVGHETDFTISDFVADLRAPTPSAAAELAVPDIIDMKNNLKKNVVRLKNSVISSLDYAEMTVGKFDSKFLYSTEMRILYNKQLIFQNAIQKINSGCRLFVSDISAKISTLSSSLAALNPDNILKRGYTYTTSESGQVADIDSINIDDLIKVIFCNGTLDCKVINKDKTE